MKKVYGIFSGRRAHGNTRSDAHDGESSTDETAVAGSPAAGDSSCPPPYLDMSPATKSLRSLTETTGRTKSFRRRRRSRQDDSPSAPISHRESLESAPKSSPKGTVFRRKTLRQKNSATVAVATPDRVVIADDTTSVTSHDPPTRAIPISALPRSSLAPSYAATLSQRLSAVKLPPPLVPEEAEPAVQEALRQGDSTNSTFVLDDEGQHQVNQAVVALDQAGNSFFVQGMYDEAFNCYERALVLKRRALLFQEGQGEGTNQTVSKVNAIDAAEAGVDKATSPQQKSGDDELSHKDSVLASLATSINNMTYLKQRSGKASSEETMASYVKSLQMKIDILGPNHVSVGKTLNNIGSVFYLKREYEQALAAYQNAHRIMQDRLGVEHLDVGTVISNIGDVYAATGESSLALEQYRQALSVRWNALGQRDPKVVRLMEQIARLETGLQPQKMEDDCSESEDEEFQDQGGRRNDCDPVLVDAKSLQEELREDMKFFDLVERKMAIDMVKDKTRIFREMRELASASLKEDAKPDGIGSGGQTEKREAKKEPIPSSSPSPTSVTERAATAVPNPAASTAPAATVDISGVGGARMLHKENENNLSRLTPNDRKKALDSVRARLERLRASRDNHATLTTTAMPAASAGKTLVPMTSAIDC